MARRGRIALSGWQRAAAPVMAVLILAVLTANLVVKAVHVQIAAHPDIMREFDMNQEANVPTWLSVVLLLACGELAGLICWNSLADAPTLRGRLRGVAGGWAVISALFLLMSLDELASFHELLSGVTAKALGHGSGAFVHVAWLIPGALIAVVMLVVGVRWSRGVDRRVQVGMIVGGVMYFTGALVFEGLSQADRLAKHPSAKPTDVVDLTYTLLSAVEETLELSGAALVVLVFLGHLQRMRRSAADTSLRSSQPAAR